MEMFLQISVAILCLFIVWRIYKQLKQNPGLFSRQAISQSLTTMGVLALILIGGVAMMILLLK